MALTILLIWVGSVAIGIAGANAALSNRWVTVLAYNVVAGAFSIALLGSLRGEYAATLLGAGDVYVWLTMASPVAMWIILGIGSAVAMRKQRTGRTVN